MRIQHNIAALNSYRQLSGNNSALSKNLEKLSSGYRINRAGDDAAGLAISEKMRAQIKGLEAAQKNANDGISLVQTAEGALTEVHSMLNRMVYLATQSANGTYDNDTDRYQLQKEMDQLRGEIDRIADSSNFNGIKLLDGSMDSEGTSKLLDSSAISNITTSEFSPAGKADAFEAKYITNRPEASTTQTNASFTVKFDDLAIAAPTTGNTKLTVNIGDATVTMDFGDTAAKTGADVAAMLAKYGSKVGTTAKEQTDGAAKVTDSETSKWDNDTTANTTAGGDADAKYLKVNGHWYSMAATGDTVTFTQVDSSETSGELINPDFDVSVKQENGVASGTTNWKVQNPVQGEAIGSSHQAQVEVSIDFSKLKNGDVLTAGDMTYYFKLDAADTTTSTAATAGNNAVTVIDLTSVFKETSDITNADKQAEAMVSIAKQMGAVVDETAGTDQANKSDTWSVGNGGVSDGVGKLTFQSLSVYDGDTTAANKSHIAGNDGNDVCDMRTEASVMKQFYAESKAAAASVSFELDVTKLKAGDTITIDGTTFEFCDGTVPSSKENVVIDLSAQGIAGGLRSSQTNEVMDLLKTAINNTLNYGYAQNSANLSTKYDISTDGNKMILTSKDNATTAGVKEDRITAEIKLGSDAYEGKALTLQIGDTADEYNKLTLNIKDAHVAALGLSDIKITDQDSAAAAVDAIKSAINSVSDIRGSLGAIQNRLEHTINNLGVQTENITAAESRIRDTDMAEEMMAYTKNNILVQAAQAMLAQANQVPQGVLQLLQ